MPLLSRSLAFTFTPFIVMQSIQDSRRRCRAREFFCGGQSAASVRNNVSSQFATQQTHSRFPRLPLSPSSHQIPINNIHSTSSSPPNHKPADRPYSKPPPSPTTTPISCLQFPVAEPNQQFLTPLAAFSSVSLRSVHCSRYDDSLVMGAHGVLLGRQSRETPCE